MIMKQGKWDFSYFESRDICKQSNALLQHGSYGSGTFLPEMKVHNHFVAHLYASLNMSHQIVGLHV